jgi:hypothetical protein
MSYCLEAFLFQLIPGEGELCVQQEVLAHCYPQVMRHGISRGTIRQRMSTLRQTLYIWIPRGSLRIYCTGAILKNIAQLKAASNSWHLKFVYISRWYVVAILDHQPINWRHHLAGRNSG